MAEAFLQLSTSDQREALVFVSGVSGRPIHLLQKDVWVVWALETLCASAVEPHLIFKGGTSLSKAYGIIDRFSEDVDLTYGIRTLAPRDRGSLGPLGRRRCSPNYQIFARVRQLAGECSGGRGSDLYRIRTFYVGNGICATRGYVGVWRTLDGRTLGRTRYHLRCCDRLTTTDISDGNTTSHAN